MKHINIILQNLRAKQKRQQATLEITREQVAELQMLADRESDQLELADKKAPSQKEGR